MNRDEILECDDRPIESVDVPEWGCSVKVRTMASAERDKYEQSVVDIDSGKRNFRNLRAKLCVLTIVDDDGELIFGPNDAEKLGAKSAKAIDRIFEVAQRLNGIGQGDIEELEKNSGTVPDGDLYLD